MHRPPSRLIIIALILSPLTGVAQTFTDLDFSHNIQATNAIYPNNSTLGPDYYSGATFDFANVAYVNGMAVDARVSLISTTPGYDFVGYIPAYDSAVGGPAGDLGVYYRFNGDFNNPTGGMAYTISFYQSGSNFTASQTLSDVRFLIYDHDGEPTQSESLRTYRSDGFTGYQLGNTSGINAIDEGTTWRFDARGQNFPEDSPEGGFVAYYHDTSSIRFDIFSTTTGGPVANYGVFTAFDGDVSLLGGNFSGLGPLVAVPEPTSPLLVAVALSFALSQRRRVRR